jgi:hypothetical protein
MRAEPNDEPPPKSTDLEGWRRAIQEGRHTGCRLEEIVAAIQDLGPRADKAVLNPLAKHLSDALLGILRARVGVNHPNRGVDIIERVHGQLFEAILQPASADGRALRAAFVPRVTFRIKDALVAEARAARQVPLRETDTGGDPNARRGADASGERVPMPRDLSGVLGESMDVEAILEQVTDERKRLAFRLFMDGVPFKSSKSRSIEEALDVSERTARDWVKEVQDLLSSVPAVQDILKAREST